MLLLKIQKDLCHPKSSGTFEKRAAEVIISLKSRPKRLDTSTSEVAVTRAEYWFCHCSLWGFALHKEHIFYSKKKTNEKKKNIVWSHFVIYHNLLLINSLNSSHPLSVGPYLFPSVESGQKQSPFSVHRCGRMGGMLWRSPLGQSQAILKGEHLTEQIVSDRKTAFKWFERRTN